MLMINSWNVIDTELECYWYRARMLLMQS